MTLRIELENLPKPTYRFSSTDPLEPCYRSSLTQPIFGSKSSLLENLITAYANDLPLSISPDTIWLLICQGFAWHIFYNPEQFRSRLFTSNEEQTIDLTDERCKKEDVPVADWREILSIFPSEIRKQLKDPTLVDNLTFDFSTSTPDIITAGHITLMVAMKQFINYSFLLFGCGTPYIELEGTVEDWEKIERKAQYLATFDLEWWISEILPILAKITDSKRGNIDTEFWKSMIKKKDFGDYPQFEIGGWITLFFPYFNNGQKRIFEPLPDFSIPQLPPTILEAPFTLKEISPPNEAVYVFNSGFLGVTQDPETLLVKPVIGWYIKPQ